MKNKKCKMKNGKAPGQAVFHLPFFIFHFSFFISLVVLSAWCVSIPVAFAEILPTASRPDRPTAGGPAKLDDVQIYLVLKDGNKLVGELAGYDKFVVRVSEGPGKIASATWDQLLPAGSYYLQKRLTDPNSAEVNFRLGCYCWAHGLHDEAYTHFERCKRLDPSYGEKVKQVVTNKFPGPVESAIALTDPKELEELEKQSAAGAAGVAGFRVEKPAQVVKYEHVPAEIQAKLVEQVRQLGQKVADKMDVKLRTVETDHFCLFTDWPAADDRGLSEMFESIYSRLASQFDIPSTENIYVGKLPVFCWQDKDEFTKCATDINHFTVAPQVLAYVRSSGTGAQMMNLYRYSNRLLLEKVCTHECVHSFVNRYRSNVPLEAWMNEGLAEVMAGTLVPRSRVIERARTYVATGPRTDADKLLEGGYEMLAANLYPAATTMVDYLLRKDAAKFLGMIDKIKAGESTEDALKASYGLTYETLTTGWRRWVASNFPNRPN